MQPGTAGKRERLTALVNALKQQTEAYEAAARNEWADSNALSDKRRLRQEPVGFKDQLPSMVNLRR